MCAHLSLYVCISRGKSNPYVLQTELTPHLQCSREAGTQQDKSSNVNLGCRRRSSVYEIGVAGAAYHHYSGVTGFASCRSCTAPGVCVLLQ